MKLFGKQTTLIVIALGILGTTLFSSCKKDDPTPAAKNIAEIVASDANFSLIHHPRSIADVD
jgi:hypothetical protein